AGDPADAFLLLDRSGRAAGGLHLRLDGRSARPGVAPRVAVVATARNLGCGTRNSVRRLVPCRPQGRRAALGLLGVPLGRGEVKKRHRLRCEGLGHGRGGAAARACYDARLEGMARFIVPAVECFVGKKRGIEAKLARLAALSKEPVSVATSDEL